MFHEQDQEWINKITVYRNKLSRINITDNITSLEGKQILSLLDELYSEVRIVYGDVSKRFDEVESLIERIRRKAEARGTNSEVRKANGIKAVETVETADGRTHNLYEVRTLFLSQKEDLQGILAVLDKKQSMVITMSGLLKVESNISGH